MKSQALFRPTLSTLFVATALLLLPTEARADHRDASRWWRPPPRAVPELSANAAGSALFLIAGGLVVAAGRRRRAES
jgi:hypothetical protein